MSRVCPRSLARRSFCDLLDKENLQLDMTKLGFEKGQLDFKDVHPSALRHGARHRADRFR